ncbi:MAG: hypothetical protein LBE10_09075 [Treponema sp.]|jgi:hypothetical protein|nr:hypothetical protein [Treponema sp.]
MVFNPAAFKHGVGVAGIRMAFNAAKYDGFLDEDDPDAEYTHLLTGFDRVSKGAPIYSIERE